MAAVNHLQYSFLKLLFWPSNRRPNQYAIFHPYTKFHKNRTIRCWVIAKTLFRKSQSWISKIWNLCEMTASFIGISFYAPNFIKIGDFLLRYGDLTIFKMAAVRHLGFSKLALFVMWPLSACHSALSWKNSLKSDNELTSYGQKQFSIWRPSAIFNFKKIVITWLLSSSISAVVYQISSKSDNCCREMLCISATYAVMRCPFVCLTVTFVYSEETNKRIFKLFSPSGIVL